MVRRQKASQTIARKMESDTFVNWAVEGEGENPPRSAVAKSLDPCTSVSVSLRHLLATSTVANKTIITGSLVTPL